jgi:hypothetical protein
MYLLFAKGWLLSSTGKSAVMQQTSKLPLGPDPDGQLSEAPDSNPERQYQNPDTPRGPGKQMTHEQGHSAQRNRGENQKADVA